MIFALNLVVTINQIPVDLRSAKRGVLEATCEREHYINLVKDVWRGNLLILIAGDGREHSPVVPPSLPVFPLSFSFCISAVSEVTEPKIT